MRLSNEWPYEGYLAAQAQTKFHQEPSEKRRSADACSA